MLAALAAAASSAVSSAIASVVRSAVADAVAVLLPVDCAGCGSADRSVCTSCSLELRGEPIRSTVDDLPVVCATRYSGAARRLVLALKEHGRTDVIGQLSASLARVLPAECELAPVPSSRESRSRRGYDPVRLLVAGTGRRGANVLALTRRAAVQKALDLEERAANREGSMRARGRLDGRRFVIVDDVVTSGATVREAARAIRDAGGTVEGVVAFAVTPRVHPVRT
jgi:predicted amidophosphoribosyltransferase